MKKNLSKILLAVLVTVFAVLLSGCGKEPEVKQFSVSFKEAGPGYITLNATVPYTIRCAYTVSEVALPSSIMNATYLNMTGEELYIYSDGEIQLCDFDIEENKKYYVYLVALLSESQFSEVYQWEFETGEFNFSQLATVVSVAPDGYKMHITVPETVKKSEYGKPGSRAIRFAQSDIMMYNYYSGEDDYGHMLYNGARYIMEDTTIEYSDEANIGSTGIDSNEDGVVDENDVGMLWNPIAPGEPVVFVAGEFEWMEEPEGFDKDDNYTVNGFFYPAGWDPGYYLPCIDSTKYWSFYKSSKSAVDTKSINKIEGIDLSSELDGAWTGAFQRKIFRTRIPDKLDANINVTIEDLKSVNATVVITPDDKIYRYVFTILDQGSYEQMLDLLDGNEEYLQWATTSFFSMYNFAALDVTAGTGETMAPIAEIELTDFFYDVTSETKYHVLVTGMSGEIGSPQCFTHYEFSTPKKTKTEGPTIVVETLDDKVTPYSAAFNVKCTSVADNPADRCYYGANYYKDWVLEVNRGSKYETLGQTAQFTAAELEKINSDEGLDVYIPSIDGETTRLVVVAFNDENISNGVDEWPNVLDCPAVADCTTPFYEADLEYNELLDTDALVDEWTITATDINGNVIKDKVAIKRQLIEGEDYPSDLPAEVKDIYKKTTKWTDDEIEGYFEQFKYLAEEYNEYRLRGQNKLLLEGWFDNDSHGRTSLMTPWDIFKSEKVVTVDVESMFSEYGPKIYITVDDDELYIVSDRMYASPVLNWSQSMPFYLAGRADQETNNTIFYYGDSGYYEAPLVFPVTLSEDMNTITIKPIHATNGLDYYPNLVGIDQMSYSYVSENPVVSEVVLTRGWTEPEAAVAAPAVKSAAGRKSSSITPATAVPEVAYKHKTDFSGAKRTIKIKKEVMTVEKLNENLDKFSEKLTKRNR